MSVMSLEELKRANAEAPATENPTAEPEVEEKPEPVEEPVDSEQSEEAEDQDGEAWKQAGDKPPKERKFTDSDIGAAKAQLRAKLEKRHQAEVERLRAENERLKSATVAPPAQSLPPIPTEEQFGYDQEKYRKAVTEWHAKVSAATVDAAQQKLQQKRAIEEAQRQLSQAEDEHYSRAAKLVEQNGISADSYRVADEKVRAAFERVRPGGGDTVAAQLMSIIGEGSEKLFYWLGINEKELYAVEGMLATDPTGMRAIAHLSRKAAEFTLPPKRTSNAPQPPTQISGDAKTPAAEKAIRERYRKAHEKGDAQAAWEARRQARAAGIDTKSW